MRLPDCRRGSLWRAPADMRANPDKRIGVSADSACWEAGASIALSYSGLRPRGARSRVHFREGLPAWRETAVMFAQSRNADISLSRPAAADGSIPRTGRIFPDDDRPI